MRAGLVAAALLAAAAASAQYKVVGPDGKVTYTDRPGTAVGTVTALGRSGAPAAAAPPALPFELRQLAARFPVTLYTTPDCSPCERGRRLLLQRGIPFSERLVQTDDDQVALERLVGTRTVPVLAVGAQLSRGWLESEWQSNLDLAGYPQQSQLPREWRPPAATPLAAPRAEAPASAAPAAAAEPATPTPAVPPAPAAADAPAVRF